MKPITQKPGAGLPFVEALVLRYWMFPRSVRRLGHQGSRRLWIHESETVLKLVESVPPEKAGVPVLINRIRGLEDSSRCWSILQTLEHVDTVSRLMIQTAQSLERGVVPGGKVSTADVKPQQGWQPSDWKERWQRLSGDILRALSEEEVMRGDVGQGSGLRYEHPWFGPLSSVEWRALVSLHLRIHRHQIEAIARTFIA